MTRVLVLGAGLVGATIARDLANEFSVTVIDKNKNSLARIADDSIEYLLDDVLSINEKFLKRFDIVVGALPSWLGLDVASFVLTAGKDYVDISFAPQDLRCLRDLAHQNGSRCLIDFGVAPGLSHLVFGHYKNILKRVNEYYIHVGGLLKNPCAPWYYKAPFSPIDVIEEYTRPARYISNGEVMTSPALSQPEMSHLEGYGNIEAFLTDGVRSLLSVDNVDTIVEKTIRPRGYRDKIQLLIDSGFFNEGFIEVNNHKIIPRDVTTKILIDSWKMGPDDLDMTIMQLLVKGTDFMGSDFVRSHYLLDHHDGVNSSMARTTGFMCTAGVRLLINRLWDTAGVFAPETIGEDRRCFEFIINDLGRHGIKLIERPPLPGFPEDTAQNLPF